MSSARRSRILIVDDQPHVLDLLRDTFEASGYAVDTAVDGAQALAQVTSQHSYDAILSDIRMPVLDGPELYDELVRRYPALAARILFMTGETLSPMSSAFLNRTNVPHVLKPFTLVEVLTMVERAVAGAGPDPGADE
jgi:CheY-like chemotaxis protein